jgi:hypothetical protein
MWYPHLVGYHRPLVASTNWWKYVDIDLETAATRGKPPVTASK